MMSTRSITTSGQLEIQTIVREALKKLSNLGESLNLPDPPHYDPAGGHN